MSLGWGVNIPWRSAGHSWKVSLPRHHRCPAFEDREGWGEASAKKLVAAIEARRTIALDRFINALGIPQVGQATSRLLARHYRSLAAWRHEMEAAAKELLDETRYFTQARSEKWPATDPI